MPEIRGLNLKDAKKTLKELELDINLQVELGEDAKEEDIIIKEQSPKPGIKVNKASKIKIEI